MKKLLLIVLACILVTGALSGCSFAKDKNGTGTEPPNETNQSETNSGNPVDKDSSKDSEIDTNTEKVVLYFHDKEAIGVIKEQRDIPVTETNGVEDMAKACVEELIKGSNEGLASSIPEGTEVKSVKMDNKTLVVDLSEDFEKGHIGGSAGVLMTMSQLVLTLTELEGVEQVAFKINGRTLEDFKGHIEFNKPFSRGEFEQYIIK